MLCNWSVNPSGGMRCDECGTILPSAIERECSAEVSLQELRKMHMGQLPPRAVAITAWQVRQIHEEFGTANLLTSEEISHLFPNESDAMLIGSKLKKLFNYLGIPPCAGCKERAEWMDKAHLIVLNLFK